MNPTYNWEGANIYFLTVCIIWIICILWNNYTLIFDILCEFIMFSNPFYFQNIWFDGNYFRNCPYSNSLLSLYVYFNGLFSWFVFCSFAWNHLILFSKMSLNILLFLLSFDFMSHIFRLFDFLHFELTTSKHKLRFYWLNMKCTWSSSIWFLELFSWRALNKAIDLKDWWAEELVPLQVQWINYLSISPRNKVFTFQ